MNYFIFLFLGGTMMSGAALFEASVLLRAYREGEIQYDRMGSTINTYDDPEGFKRELHKLTGMIFAYLAAGIVLIIVGVISQAQGLF